MEARLRENEIRTAPARVVIADDHALARAGLRDVLSDNSLIEIVGEASDGQEAFDLCSDMNPDLILMDVRMPRMDGLAATRAVKSRHPKTIVLMLTMHDNPDYLFESLKAGACGYVLKDASEEELVSAIERSLEGESPLDQALATALLRRMITESVQSEPKSSKRDEIERKRLDLEPLTAREKDVLRLMITGKTNRQIAESMYLSSNTVKTHVQHIIRKLSVSDRTQAATFAIEAGLLD